MKNPLQRDDEDALYCPTAFGTVAVAITVPERKWGRWRQVEYVVTDLGFWRHADRTWWYHPSVQPRGLHREVRSRFEEWALRFGVHWNV